MGNADVFLDDLIEKLNDMSHRLERVEKMIHLAFQGIRVDIGPVGLTKEQVNELSKLFTSLHNTLMEKEGEEDD